jgi:hypothetical protein
LFIFDSDFKLDNWNSKDFANNFPTLESPIITTTKIHQAINLIAYFFINIIIKENPPYPYYYCYLKSYFQPFN